jgi:hypothetical protein
MKPMAYKVLAVEQIQKFREANLCVCRNQKRGKETQPDH